MPYGSASRPSGILSVHNLPQSSLIPSRELDSLLVTFGSHSGSGSSVYEGTTAPLFNPAIPQVSTSQSHYACPWCHREFSKSSNLKRHILTHTGEKPYACPVCPYRAVQKVQVVHHLKSKHSDGRDKLVCLAEQPSENLE